jgi:hypothetical protein
MSSPLDNSNSSNNIRQPQSFAIGQTPPAITEEEKKSTKDIGDIKEMGIIPFAVSTAVHRNELISSSVSRSSLTNNVPENTMPPLRFFAVLLEVAVADLHRDFPKHLQSLARKFHHVCTFGLLTQNRANKLGISVDVSNDVVIKDSRVSLNFIHKPRGIFDSLSNEARGGLSVSLERGRSDELRKKAPDFSEADKEELSERAHQTILIGIYASEGDRGFAKMKLIRDFGPQFEEPRIDDNQACPLNRSDSIGSNETFTSLSIDPFNFNFILVPERLMPLAERYLEKVKIPCVVYAVPSANRLVYFNRTPLEISCPDYRDKLKELIKDGCLTHVLRDKSKKTE